MYWYREWEHWELELTAEIETVSKGSNYSIQNVYITASTNLGYKATFTVTVTYGGQTRQITQEYPASGAKVVFNFNQTTYHDSDGDATVGFKMSTGFSGGYETPQYWIPLDHIPQTTTITSYTITNQTFTSAQINWATAHQVNRVEFRLGGVSRPWQLGTSHTGSSGSFTITGLSPDWYATTYIRARKVGSSEWTYSTGKPLETLKIAKFTSVPDNIDFSKPFTVEFNRNDATVVDIGIYNTSGSGTFAIYRTVTGTSYTFDLTEEEKNRFYDDMPTVEGKYYSVYIATNSNAYREAHNRTFLIRDAYPSQPIFEYEDIDEDTLELTGSKLIFIQNYSKLKLKITASTAFRGATIKKYIVSNGYKTKEYTSAGTKNDFGVIVAQQLQVTAVDSRGFLSTNIIQLNYKEYTQPLIQNLSIERVIGTGTTAKLVTDGLYLNINFGAVVNKIKKVEYRRKSTGDYGIWHDITTLVLYGSGTFNNAAISNITGFTFGTEYTCEIRVTDELSFATRTTIVSKGMFTALIDKEYGSVGIGEIPKQEENSLIVKGNIYAPNIITYEIISDI